MIYLVTVLALAASGTEASPVESSEDPVVCKGSKIPAVGTRFKPKPVCKRKSEWAMDQRSTQRELQQINERGSNPGKAEGR